MGLVSYRASAPGSLFLLGEHAVLHDKRALVTSVDKRITATLKPRNDDKVMIDCSLGKLETRLCDLETRLDPHFQFVLSTILYFKEKLSSGFELDIVSEFPHNIGFGSSAAVVVSVFAVLDKFTQACQKTDEKFFLEYLFTETRKIIRQVQGMGSGADAAASVYGGIVAYQQIDPCVLRRFSQLPPLVVVYSGFKTPTPKVVERVEQQRIKYPKVFKALYEASDASVQEALKALENEDWVALGEILTLQQGVLNAIGVGMPLLTRFVDSLNAEPKIYGAKISGSGLGDCLVGIGECSAAFDQKNTIPVSVSLKGVCYE